MTTIVRWIVVGIITLHGLIHLMGPVEAFGWADLEQLTEPIGTAAGLVWLVAAILVLVAAATTALSRPAWWWAVVGAAALVSQAVVVTSWSDAKAGTVANVLMLLAAGYGFATRERAAETRPAGSPSPQPVAGGR